LPDLVAPSATTQATPAIGRYIRCSNIRSASGRTELSTAWDRKKNRIPNEASGRRRRRRNPATMRLASRTAEIRETGCSGPLLTATPWSSACPGGQNSKPRYRVSTVHCVTK
jgi:hypothetical protein